GGRAIGVSTATGQSRSASARAASGPATPSGDVRGRPRTSSFSASKTAATSTSSDEMPADSTFLPAPAATNDSLTGGPATLNHRYAGIGRHRLDRGGARRSPA